MGIMKEIKQVLIDFGMEIPAENNFSKRKKRPPPLYKCPICGSEQNTVIVLECYRIYIRDEIYRYVLDQDYEEGYYRWKFNCGHIVDEEQDQISSFSLGNLKDEKEEEDLI